MKHLQRFYNNSKFRTKLMMIFVVTALLPIIMILIFSARLNRSNMTKKVDELMENNLVQIAERVNLNLEVYTNLVYQIYQDEEVSENIKNLMDSKETGYAAAYNQINKRLKQYNTSDEGVRCISVVCADGSAVIYDFSTDSFVNHLWQEYSDLRTTEPYKEAVDKPGMVIVPTTTFQENGEKKEYFHIAKRVFDLDHLERGAIATIIVSVDANVLNDICNASDNQEQGINFIMNQENLIISYPDMEFSGMKKNSHLSIEKLVQVSGYMQNKKIAVNSYEDKTTGWTFYNVYDKEYMLRDVTQAQKIYIFVGILAVISATGAILLLVRQINQSVHGVISGIQKFQEGDMEAQVEVKYHDEIGEIADNFNGMTGRIKKLIKEIKTVTAKQKNAEIRALEAQINPHFLYNTLDSINWMAIEKGEYEISRMIRNLGIILRYSVSKSNSIVTIEMVEDWLEKYISLQQMRFDHTFDYKIYVEEQAKQQKIHKLLIQPFIENAILHGLKEKHGDGLLCVDIRLSEDNRTICIIIEDNGSGMTEKEKEHYNNREEAVRDDGRSIGLHNVFARLEMYYGELAEWNVTSFPDMGTVITLKIPVTGVMKS